MKDISVVIPVYGCPNALIELYERLKKVLDQMHVSYEVILVDDCCPLNSLDIIEKICMNDERVKGIHFARNFGQMQAIYAGVNNSEGEYIITMDCDLQDIPENIPMLYSKIREGYDVVFVRRKNRKDSIVTQFWGRIFHKVFSYLCELDFDFDLATYLIASKRAAEKYKESKGSGRDFGMYLMWLGYKRDFIEFDHGERHSGKSSYTFIKKIKYAVSTMTMFSNRVLYLPIIVGVISSFVSAIYLLFVFYAFFFMRVNPEGWTTIVASIFLFGGLILNAIGIIGIYIGNVYDTSKSRPLYVVQDKLNCK